MSSLVGGERPPRPRFRRTHAAILAVALLWLPAAVLPVRAADPTDDYNLAAGLYKQNRWSLAAESFRDFLKNHPDHARVPFARLYLGLTLINLQEYKDARDVLRDYAKSYPESKNLADAMYRVGECSYLLDELKTAEAEFTAFHKKFPESELGEWSLPYLADVQLRLEKPQAAEQTFHRSLQRFPQGKLAEDSRFGLARSLEMLNRPDDAAGVYAEIAANANGARAPQALLNLSNRQFDLGKFSEAAAGFTRLTETFPESPLVPLARLNAGYSYYQLGEFAKAIEQFDSAAQAPEQTRTATYWKGLALKSLEQFADAAALLKQTYESKPDDPLAPTAFYHWADCDLRRGEFAAAEARFLEFVDKWPKADNAPDALHFAAEAAMLGGRLDEADQLIARFGTEFPNSPLRMHQDLLAGRILDARGNSGEAITRFEAVLAGSESPRTRSLARMHLARALERQKEYGRVVTVLAPLLVDVRKAGAASQFAEALVLNARALYEQQQFAPADESAAEYLKMKPDGAQADAALAVRAVALARLNQLDAAEAQLKELQDKFATSPLKSQATHDLAEIAFAQSDWERSARWFESLAGPDSPWTAPGMSGAGWSRFQQGQYDAAAQWFAKAIGAHSDRPDLNAEAAYMRGRSLEEADKLPDAAAAFDEAFVKFASTDPAPPGAEASGVGRYAFLAGLQAARSRSKLKEVDAADAAYDRVLKHFPQAAERDKLLDEWALLNYRNERYERADELFRRLVELVPDSPLADDAALSLAESDYMAGKLEPAEAAFTSLVESTKSDDSVKDVARSQLVGIAVEQADWNTALERSAAYLQQHPNGKQKLQVQFQRAEALVRVDRFEEAVPLLAELRAASLPADAAWAPRVWILTAETQYRGKQYEEVSATLAELRAKFPAAPNLYEADDIVGRALKNQEKFDDARAAFQRVIDDPVGKTTETGAKCQFLIAETYLLEKQFEPAQKEYLKVYHLHKFPAWQAMALYQAAACDEALARWSSAATAYADLIKEFPDSEYAAKAKPRLEAAKRKAG